MRRKQQVGEVRCPARGPSGEVCGYLASHVDSEHESLRSHDWRSPEEAEIRRAASNLCEWGYQVNKLVGRAAVEGTPHAALTEWTGIGQERIEELAALTREGAFGEIASR